MLEWGIRSTTSHVAPTLSSSWWSNWTVRISLGMTYSERSSDQHLLSSLGAHSPEAWGLADAHNKWKTPEKEIQLSNLKMESLMDI